jgi:hypothetical protein
MQIYVTKNQNRLGPYSVADVRARLAAGQFTASDFGWHEGLTNWLPLGQLLVPFPAGPGELASTALKSSGFAKASFVIGILSIPLWLVILAVAAVSVSRGETKESPILIIAGLAMFGAMAVNLAGAVLGIVPLTRRVSNKWMAVTGLILNGTELVGILFLTILGLSRR